MKRSAIIIFALLIAGCSDNPPAPTKVCTSVIAKFSCGRSGASQCDQCGSWEIGCPKPLELRERADGSGELICRIPRRTNPCTLSLTPSPDNCDEALRTLASPTPPS